MAEEDQNRKLKRKKTRKRTRKRKLGANVKKGKFGRYVQACIHAATGVTGKFTLSKKRSDIRQRGEIELWCLCALGNGG